MIIKKELIPNIIIILLLLFSFYSTLIVGLSWDEIFHYTNGKLRFEYLKTFGQFKNYNYSNNIYYPGLYDTITYAAGYIILLLNSNFFESFFIEIQHTINFIFGSLGLIGLYKLVKIFFNKTTAYLSCIFTLLNPFFFGHLGINPKDTIIFFSYIWFIYFFLKYLNNDKNKIFYLLYTSFFISFGCGIRISFLAIIVPIIIVGIIFLIKKKNFQNLIVYLIRDTIIALTIIISLVTISWPHIIDGGFKIFLDTIYKSLRWSAVPSHGILNGEFYEIRNTPSSYFIKFITYRMPFYTTFLIIYSYLIFLFDKKIFIKMYDKNFKIKFSILNLIVFYPLFISIILKVNIYDNIRLFLFIIPFLGIVSAISFLYLLNRFKINYFTKIQLFFFIFLFFIFVTRFVSLTPYHYTYVNYMFPKLENANNKFEFDYWAVSFREIVKDLDKVFKKEEIKNIKFSFCGGDPKALGFLLNKYYNIKKMYVPKNADYIIMTNRASFKIGDKETCFTKYPGKNILEIKKQKLIFSVLRKLN
tara:strand:+ start:3480 stop:5066 length:1587 start_codon:yes stop_codon:yes gene_type:complete